MASVTWIFLVVKALLLLLESAVMVVSELFDCNAGGEAVEFARDVVSLMVGLKLDVCVEEGNATQ